MIRIFCRAADAILKETQTLTSGMTNYPTVVLTFSQDWDGFGKAAVVRAGNVTIDVLITNNSFVIPAECLETSGVNLSVGISGSNGTETIPTIWCAVGEIYEGADVNEGSNLGTATPTLVEQMLGYAEETAEKASVAKASAASAEEAANKAATDSEVYAKGTRDGEPVEEGEEGYHDNSKYYSEQIADGGLKSEGYAIGKQQGEDVSSGSPYYHNNSKYYCEQAAGYAEAADTWLEENFAQETGYVLDRTLTLENAAAPADLVGDLKESLTSYIYGINEQFQVEGGKVNKFNMLLLEGVKYTVTNNTGVIINVLIFKADGTQKKIIGQLTNGNSISFVPETDEYIQVGGYVNANPTGTFDVACEYSDFKNGEKIISADKLLNEVTKNIDVNIIAKVTKHENQFYNVNNQIYAGGNHWDYYTFPVSEGDTFTIDTVAGQTVRAWAFRNADQAQIAIASYNGDPVQKEYTDVIAPANAVELIVNFKHVSGYLTIIKNGEAVLNENRIYYNGIELPKYLDRINELAEEKSNILHGKVLCCCGDSITYGADMDAEGIVETPEIESYQWSGYTKTWARWTADEPAAYGYQIAARNGMIFYNGGVSGATVQAKSGSMTVPGFSDANGEYTLLPNNIDYLTLFYGWNDTAVGTLGTISDTTNASYYGAYNVVLPYLIDKYPYAKIALIVPFGTDVGHRQAIRDLADKWGVACFDMMQGGTPLYYNKEPNVDVNADIVTANRAKFQANGAHPNYRGHYQIGTMLEHFLRGI